MSRSTKQQWYVYIATARTGRLYVGISKDPTKRIDDHNSGKGAYFAKLQGPFELTYVSVPYSTKSEAAKREKQIKGWTRAKKEKLKTGEWK